MGNGRAPAQIFIVSLRGDRSLSTPGFRVLVDREWPWDIPRDEAPVDEWMPELGPSPWLTDMFGEDPLRWGTFRSRYRRQLRSKTRRALLASVARKAGNRPIVLVTATPDVECNHARIIEEVLREGIATRG